MSSRISRVLIVLCMGGMVAACSSASHVRTDKQPTSTSPRGSTPSAEPRSVSGPSYRVSRGDTMYGIAFRNGLDFRDLANWNNISSPYTIYIGQNLRLTPPGTSVASSTNTRRPSTTPRASTSTAPRPAPTGPAAAASAGAVTTAPPPSAQHPVIQSSGPVAFRWPIDGPLLARYTSGDPARAGIDIGAAGGTQVRAAADGEVVYSGNGLVLYGELIIIKHTNSLLSAYARNGRRLVEEGSRVKAGQPIAEVGAARKSLHFEIRRDGKPVNPLDYLPKK